MHMLRLPLSNRRSSVLEAIMVHWNNLSVGARELLQRLIEGSRREPSDCSEMELTEKGLIEKSGDGWRPTQAGLSAYVIRDDPSDDVLPLRRRWWVSADARRATSDLHPLSAGRKRV
jgi:hypothetical protein